MTVLVTVLKGEGQSRWWTIWWNTYINVFQEVHNVIPKVQTNIYIVKKYWTNNNVDA